MTDQEVAEAYEKYGHLVLRRCQWIMRDPAAADDALQEVFVRLWRHGDAFRDAEAKVPWLNRVAERCCFDLLARRKARAESPIEDVDDIESVDETNHSFEDRELVQKILERFDDQTKQIALLHYLDELTYEEIGTVMGLSRQTVSKRLSFLRERAQRFHTRLAKQEGIR